MQELFSSEHEEWKGCVMESQIVSTEGFEDEKRSRTIGICTKMSRSTMEGCL